ncbi:hypothetical protein MtrunA17_Chr8g0392941 [Medicago truncatula]|uniref:Uncharacterized protein n=1 Tax=Medicago truncatula TaxID=3880 RepID=A0A396GRX9_MEDTR|nr:hypothetical protein MtrunA17_Chr8g0392941 [Medicago truncatula]
MAVNHAISFSLTSRTFPCKRTPNPQKKKEHRTLFYLLLPLIYPKMSPSTFPSHHSPSPIPSVTSSPSPSSNLPAPSAPEASFVLLRVPDR